MADASLKIENARYIITMDPQRRIISDGSVIVSGSRIAQVGKAAGTGRRRRGAGC